MYCRLLDDLDTQARNAPDRISWARAACKIAVHRARQGQVDEAHALILRVRETFGVALHHEIASWVMLAEGVIHYFRWDKKMSWERLRRAYALAKALKMESAQAICASWMALLSFNISRFDDMSDFLREVLTNTDTNNHHARGRAALVLADAYHSANRYDLARRWYDRARNHAAAEGDQAQISAMLFNVATIRTANVRIANAFGIRQEWEELRAKMEAGSSMTYDAAVGASSYEGETPLMRGQLMVVEGNFLEARKILDGIGEQTIWKADIPLLLADRAFCCAHLGEMDSARNLVDRCRSVMLGLQHPDDLAFIYSRLSEISNIFGAEEESMHYKDLANKGLIDHRAYQAEMFGRLTALTDALNTCTK